MQVGDTFRRLGIGDDGDDDGDGDENDDHYRQSIEGRRQEGLQLNGQDVYIWIRQGTNTWHALSLIAITIRLHSCDSKSLVLDTTFLESRKMSGSFL